ncbi:coth protein-domain-containing protein [Mycotypha africana]|uniref:coth protein-domain-containing protein n=1 Tax=Mycotypha africana TaxID=64632 RepID=UPI0023001EEE|nr:coth protein-domain-containing protein [Mycotypha africana]KAI8991221.1 coth protein-domain-containing protein [Mycotypha africana]
MQIFTAIGFLLASFSSLATRAVVADESNITYNVIYNVPDNQTLAVVLDNHQVYPLNDTSKATPLLHMGQAPRPLNEYKYGILDKHTNDIISQEPFTRHLPSSNTSSTLNEHFNRTWTVADEYQLPSVFEPLPVIHRIDSKIHIPGQIPTIHIMGNSTGIDYMQSHQLTDIDVEGLKMAYISAEEVKTFDGVRFSVSGHSTRNMPKLAYSIKLPKKQDLYNYRRFKLRANAMDPSYMKENIGYSVANAVGLPASEYSYVRLYINNQPIGLFGFVEHLKNPWIRNEFANGDKDYKQGALYVGGKEGLLNFTNKEQTSNESEGESEITNNYKPDFSYFGTNLSLYEEYYPVKEDPSKGKANYTRIMEFTKFLSEQSNTTAVDNSMAPRWEQYIDVESFLRTFALEVLIMDTDGYIANANNFVLYDDLNADRLVMSDQDFDLSCGTILPQLNSTFMYSGNYSDFPGLLTQPLTSKMLKVPQFKDRFNQILRNYTKGLFANAAIQKRIDSLYNLLKEDVAWDKSLPPVGKFLIPLPANMTGSADPSAFFRDFSFEKAVYGPISIPMIQQHSIAEWAKIRGDNLEEFFNKTNINTTTFAS